MAVPTPPYLVVLARRPFRWYPCLELSADLDRAVFLSIAERLVSEFQGEIVERYGSSGPSGKEYWWIEVGSKRLLLMRKDGIGLPGENWTDINLFIRIADSFGAEFVGWRLKLWRMWRRWLGPC